MDSGKMWLLLLILAQLMRCMNAMGHFVFEVHHKYGEGEAVLGAMRAHDLQRHARNLAAIDFQLGGHFSPANDAYISHSSFISSVCDFLKLELYIDTRNLSFGDIGHFQILLYSMH